MRLRLGRLVLTNLAYVFPAAIVVEGLLGQGRYVGGPRHGWLPHPVLF